MDKKRYYISAASTISHQHTFQHTGFAEKLTPLEADSTLISPDFKHFIDAGLLRRMSKILRMAVACSKDCLAQANVAQPDAIVVGTGLGCLQDTEKFLGTSLTVEGLLPPTSFIQSTHNTMAGQISLSLGNHGYNMTHTQNTLSFEHALVDAMLLLNEGENEVLVGSADEYIPFLSQIAEQLDYQPGAPFTSGASFFLVGNEQGNAPAAITDCLPAALTKAPEDVLAAFLEDNQLELSAIDRILYAIPAAENKEEVWANTGINPEKCIDYLALSGVYPTASGFALHLATDLVAREHSISNVLIFNLLRKDNLGLTLVQKVEA